MTNRLNVPDLWMPQMGEAMAKEAELATEFDHEPSVSEIREAYDREHVFWNEGGPRMASTVEHQVPTEHGPVNVRCYYPTELSDGPQPVIVYFHGGGFMLGNPTSHDRITRALAHYANAPVVSVDYTLAPEARHPQQREECVAVIQYLIFHGDQWRFDGSRLTLAGDSAGAFLSLACFLHMRDALGDASSIRALLLFYGLFGLRDSASQRLLGGPWDRLAPEDVEFMLSNFLTDREQLHDPSVDLLANDLTARVPPTCIVAAELDPLRDDSRCLAAILEHAGIPHQFEEYPGIIHGFLHHQKVLPEAGHAIQTAAAFFREHGCTSA